MKSKNIRFIPILLSAFCLASVSKLNADTLALGNSAQVNHNINYQAVNANGASVAEYRIFDGNAPRVGNSYTAANVGNNYAVGLNANSCAVFFFQIPDLGTVSNPFTNATLSIGFLSYPGGGWNNIVADLYGLGVQATKTASNSMYFAGDSDDRAGTVKLADNFLNSSSYATGSLLSTSVSSSALTDYLNAAYAGGANIGKYIVLRINSDSSSNLTGASGYNLSGINSASELIPSISYEVGSIPEPKTVSLLIGFSGIFGIGVVRFLKIHR